MCDLTCYWDEHKQQYRYNTYANKIDVPLVEKLQNELS